MTTEAIEFEVRMAGAPQAAQQIEQVATALEHEGQAARTAATGTAQAATGMDAMARGGQALVQRVAGVANAIQSLSSRLGSADTTAGLVGSVAATTAQFAGMGAQLGPHGAIIGGLIGFASATASAVTSTNDLAEAEARLRGEIEGVDEVMSRAETRRRAFVADERAAASARLDALVARADAARAPAPVDTEASDALTEMMAAAERDLATPRGGGGGGRTSNAEAGYGSAMTEDALASFTSINSEEEVDRRRTIDAELADIDAEAYERTLELIEAEAQARHDADAERIEAEETKNAAILEMNAERLAKEEEAEEQARARQVEAQTEFMELGMNVAGLMTDALGQIASGEKTAEDAFKGLAKAFLQMISQYAMLKAATEFAEAIGAFASFNYGGGALHLAAGVAFTAVAVATGVGAAAINVSKPSAPARPEADQGGSGAKAGGGDVIINWNSPVVTAGTRDDLGRELGALVSAGRARYGGA